MKFQSVNSLSWAYKYNWFRIDLYLNSMKVITLLTILALVFVANSFTYAGHAISGDASKKISEGIKAQLLAALPTFTNHTTANALKADLNQADDKKRKLVSIDVATVAQIWTLFGLKDPNCDTNKDGFVTGDELKCLNKLWKFYVTK